MSQPDKKKAKPPVAKEAIKTPDGIIRKGQRRPFRKATANEIGQRIEIIAQMIRSKPTISKYEIHKHAAKHWKLEWHVVDNLYIARARELIRKQSTMSKDEAKDVVSGKLLELMANPKTANMACRTFTDIFGLSMPTRTEVTGAAGGPIATKDETDPLAGLSIERLKEIAAGKI